MPALSSVRSNRNRRLRRRFQNKIVAIDADPDAGGAPGPEPSERGLARERARRCRITACFPCASPKRKKMAVPRLSIENIGGPGVRRTPV